MMSRAKHIMNHGVIKTPVLQLRKLSTVVFSLLMFLIIQQDVFAGDAASGQLLFKANCARCHSPNLEAISTGPALYEVSSRVPSDEWLFDWIENSMLLVEAKDEYALKIFEENNKSQMPAFSFLTDENIDDIITWIDEWTPPVTEEVTGSTGVDFEDDSGLTGMRSIIVFLVLIVVTLLGYIAMQVAKLRGIEFMAGINFDKLNARLFLWFLILGMIGAFWSSRVWWKYFMFTNSASEHGVEIDEMFWITMFIVFMVFVVVNALLFGFCYLYGKDGGRKAKYYPENHKLELIWTVVPAIVLTILVIFGIRTWNNVMSGFEDDVQTMKVEVSGEQWGWTLRYAGNDGILGDLDVRRISGSNALGVDMEMPESQDDFISNDLVLMKGMPVDMKIRSRDVIHSVYLPHFRVKMDAVPGMDTRFQFLPIKTTKEYREDLKSNSYWAQIDSVVQMEMDITEIVDGVERTSTKMVLDTAFKYEGFEFELACTEVCGRGHFSMRKKVIVLEPEEWKLWYDSIRVHNLSAQIPHNPILQSPFESKGDFATGGKITGDAAILD